MLEINNLYKSYGNTKVLSHVNLKLEENKIYGLLGRNGVGKTTLLNIIANQIKRDSGDLQLFGEEVFENSNVVQNICIVKEKGIGLDDIKVKEIFKKARILYKDWDEDFKNILVKEFDLNTPCQSMLSVILCVAYPEQTVHIQGDVLLCLHNIPCQNYQTQQRRPFQAN